MVTSTVLEGKTGVLPSKVYPPPRDRAKVDITAALALTLTYQCRGHVYRTRDLIRGSLISTFTNLRNCDGPLQSSLASDC